MWLLNMSVKETSGLNEFNLFNHLDYTREFPIKRITNITFIRYMQKLTAYFYVRPNGYVILKGMCIPYKIGVLN